MSMGSCSVLGVSFSSLNKFSSGVSHCTACEVVCRRSRPEEVGHIVISCKNCVRERAKECNQQGQESPR